MNLSLDQFIDGFERTARDLPALLAEWESIEEDLRQEYVDQLSWMLRTRPEVIAMATPEGRLVEVAQRMGAATVVMWALRADIDAKMGITAKQLVPYAAYTVTHVGTTTDDSCSSPSVAA
jgi:hypothetical protein